MSDKVTVDTILGTLKGWVETHTPVTPALWLDASAKLLILMGDESDILYDLESKVAQMKAQMLSDERMTVAKANVTVEASEEYNQYRKQYAKVKRIEEFVKIAKKQATLRDSEIRGY